ncbi:TPA: protein activator, partial [Pseudomonas aeruginosa]|nr:protein activator [Pseudomonas aeruginosa]HEJ2025698.1 protein activator [Pseudomonas aeruginosa]HEJ2025708.1 protein activator [Pseudomonas aeruginosa]
MKSIKSLPSFAALALCLSVSSMASAATITPVNSAFTAPGTISVSSPASLNLPVTCNITFKGKTAADGSYASIDSVTVSGSNTLCSVPQMTGLPWKLTVSSTTAGKVDGVGFKILSSTCGPSTVNGSWSNATNTLSASNQSLAGN